MTLRLAFRSVGRAMATRTAYPSLARSLATHAPSTETFTASAPEGSLVAKAVEAVQNAPAGDERPIYLDMQATTPRTPCAGRDAQLLYGHVWQPPFANTLVRMGDRHRCRKGARGDCRPNRSRPQGDHLHLRRHRVQQHGHQGYCPVLQGPKATHHHHPDRAQVHSGLVPIPAG